jgi:hypothetical protein
MDLCACESEEHEHGVGPGVNAIIMLFIRRVKRELMRVYRNGCRYNERLITETGHTAGNCRPGQTLKKPKYLSTCDREERGRGEGTVYMCERGA